MQEVIESPLVPPPITTYPDYDGKKAKTYSAIQLVCGVVAIGCQAGLNTINSAASYVSGGIWVGVMVSSYFSGGIWVGVMISSYFSGGYGWE